MGLQIRRGTDAERQTITPDAGEIIWTTDTEKLYVGDGSTVGGIDVVGAGTGEQNTASNEGAGVGVYLQKTGVNLEFKGIVASGSNISVTNDAVNNDVKVGLVDSGIIMADGSNSFTGTVGVAGNDLNDVQKVIMNSDSNGLEIYAEDGTTLLFKLDSSGNLGLKGVVYPI